MLIVFTINNKTGRLFERRPPGFSKSRSPCSYYHYPEARLEQKTYIKENSNLFMDASTQDYDDKQGRLIEIKGYDNRVVIVE